MARAATAARRKRAPRGQGERLHDEILEVAERLLIETGDEEAVSIRAVADAVGVTPPSIYLHFADKNDLLFAVCEKHFERFDRVIEEAAAGVADPVESLRARGRAYVRFGLGNPEQYRILFMGKSTAMPEDFDAERFKGAAAFGHLVDAVQRAIDAGAIPPMDAVLAATAMWAAVHGLTSLLISKPTFPWPDVERLAEHLCDVQMRGLQAMGAGA